MMSPPADKPTAARILLHKILHCRICWLRFRSMAPLAPGLGMLARLLPSLITPPIGLLLVHTLIQRVLSINLLSLSLPIWQHTLVLLGSIPVAFTIRLWHSLARDWLDARANGATLPPLVPGAIGGVDLLRDAIGNAENEYPGEAFAVMGNQLGPMFNLRLLFTNLMLTSEPEYIKAILATQVASFEKGEEIRSIFSDLLGSGVFLSDGDLWKFHRSMTRPFFKRDRISDFALFDRYSLVAIDKIKQRVRDGFAVDFQDLLGRFTMDASGEFLFGYDSRTLEAGLPYPYNSATGKASNQALDKEHAAALAFAESIMRAQDLSTRRSLLGSAWPLIEFWTNKVEEEMKVIRAFLDPILQVAIGDKKNGEYFNGDGLVKDREVQEGETLVQHLVNYTQDRTIIRDEILNIGLAGRDTTSSLLTFVIYMLAEHPDVLSKLRREILDIVGPTSAILNETLRLYPPVPLNSRNTCAPVVLPPLQPGSRPFYIPKGTRVPYSTIGMHRRPDLWGPDVLEWDPERFIDERLHKYRIILSFSSSLSYSTSAVIPNPFIFLPFSAGPHICLGQQFAYHQASVFLIRLFQAFSGLSLALDAQPPDSLPPAEWRDPEKDVLGWKRRERLFVKSHLTMHVKGGIWVRLQEVS
ncbi:hypothetical protein MIND_01387100 [Mycena indigotica]|uniref:Cytochrome P450 n=1 Tax=Mycena indigotica TaxID=2126181 RepID=A0A8H6S0W5_9AGAR|nr:uncharacterized protein MIND_01387100 [Mycena indigotica]KAF7289255.1 hypothetical protein MIND_01387100 [Mycena indigotica]